MYKIVNFNVILKIYYNIKIIIKKFQIKVLQRIIINNLFQFYRINYQ